MGNGQAMPPSFPVLFFSDLHRSVQRTNQPFHTHTQTLTHTKLQCFLNTTAARAAHGSWTHAWFYTWNQEGKTGLGVGGGLSALGLFKGLWKWGLCGAAAYHIARRPKVFTYWLVPCNLDGGNGRAISLASKWATHLNTRGQKGSGTRIPPLLSLIHRLMTNITWSSTKKHLSKPLGMIHSRNSKRQWWKFRFGVF